MSVPGKPAEWLDVRSFGGIPLVERAHRRPMTGDWLLEERRTHSIIGAFYDVYRTVGFGFLEGVYVLALAEELRARKHSVAREVWVPVIYKGKELCTQRLDMVVDDRVVVEVKSSLDLSPIAHRQLYSYLRNTTLEVGLLLHFGRQPNFYRLVYSNAGQNGGRPRMERVQE